MNGTVLIVDDFCGEELEDYLRNNYDTVLYTNGRDAVNSINDDLFYQLGLIDLSLPDISGEDVINFSKSKHPEIRIYSISGYDYKPKNADGYFPKPIDFQLLLKVLYNYFEGFKSLQKVF